MSQGWIKLHRKIRDNPFYKQPAALSVWIECLLRATHEEVTIWSKRKKITLKPGQLLLGRREFAAQIGIAPSTAWFWLLQFEVDRMVDIKKTSKGSIITIHKWCDYQNLDHKVDHKKARLRTTHEPEIEPIKNVKKDKNVKETTTIVVEGAAFGNPQINEILDFFEKTMKFPSSGKKAKDRQMAHHLIKNYSLDQIKAMLIFCATNEYAPRIGSIEKLWYKRGDIIAGIKALQNKSNQRKVVKL